MDELEQQIKALIIDVLKLEDLRVEDIDSEELLFEPDGLGLDSIDGLELGVALHKRYGLKVGPITAEVKAHFSTVHKLAKFVRTQREGGADAIT
jgi:acyl carrier protein